ncbi:MAG: thioredoxin [Tenericutes bacterium GWC2_34_14]|nr:MAG: thioredoxin [Tenericutes bacterium GWA2_35_7]OHE29657.1 MAG: thioredoxin [Tenericutes bacterium GWC2_34_14]OHE34237.1 MAG: thioredoxin [Tenericutes bacterium GWE2_34_108]OHE35568.1 MAG: thioredoxin [Tenericutes bacterium GWF1_35_14]OHE38513.1 MAG: thioredoxin [Tenericutes bacterium GWF2_35_184]OHE43691.1 MAG: thioredoxin [Tenericutes bacterium RIFOXYA2_FULL_36_32]OHE45710.1 MAG: thioredoxin [Tenericutes bacterium RIFOXYB2_FULL_36_25]OHE47709.1 MAG: thioredoxin [Tenericutes bacterium 
MIDYQGQNYQDVIGQQGLVVVQYFATWCGPCKMLKPVLEQISTEMNDTKFFRVDIDLFRNQAIEAGIRSVPTVVLYKDGEEVDRQSGYQPKERIQSWMNQFK